jgi:hypothetical protein
MTGVKFRYATPSAFRRALKDRFGHIARADRRYSLDELQRQFTYDRALARLFSSDDADRWVLKGAGALLARLATARHSKDVDVFFNATDADADDAVDALRAALRIDLGDHLNFDITRVAPLQEEAKGARVHVNARLGPTSFATFHIDVVVGTAMTGTSPRPVGWAARYPRVAAEAPGPVSDYDTAVNLASRIFDPILDATATGGWDPSVRAWIPQMTLP